MWQKSTSSPRDWSSAKDYCRSLSFAGYNDWRLPDNDELHSIVDYDRSLPAIDTRYFSRYRKSGLLEHPPPSAYISGYAWRISFAHGVIGFDDKSASYYVRAVRGGKSDNGSIHSYNHVVIAKVIISGALS